MQPIFFTLILALLHKKPLKIVQNAIPFKLNLYVLESLKKSDIISKNNLFFADFFTD